MSQLILFNKPFQVLCQFSPEPGCQTLADYISIPGVYAAGRLDKASEGLLILTDDGKLQHRLTDPKFGKSKGYWVQVEGRPTAADLEPLHQGLYYQNIQYRPAQVEIIPEPQLWPRHPPIRYRAQIPTTWLNICLQEGKNHQIRKMTAAIGFPTLRLVRYRIGDWSLGALQPGEFEVIYP